MDPSTVEPLREITIRTRRRDGSWASRPIWIVVVDGDAYVRSVNAERGAWYRRVRKGADAEIEAGGETAAVKLEAVEDDETIQRVSDAYEAKYGATSRGSTDRMLTPETLPTTLRVDFAG